MIYDGTGVYGDLIEIKRDKAKKPNLSLIPLYLGQIPHKHPFHHISFDFPKNYESNDILIIPFNNPSSEKKLILVEDVQFL